MILTGKKLQLTTHEKLTEDLREFRNRQFGHCSQTSLDLEADDYSKHISIRFRGEVIGYGRVTGKEHPFFEKWFQGEIQDNFHYNRGSKKGETYFSPSATARREMIRTS